MTATTPTAARADVRRYRTGAIGPVRDALAIAERNLIALRRVPRLLVFSTIQLVVFLLLFRYVFGGVVSTSLIGVPYVCSPTRCRGSSPRSACWSAIQRPRRRRRSR